MILSHSNVDHSVEDNSVKSKDLEDELDWRDDTTNLLNPTLWTNTIPIEVLYTNSPINVEDIKFDIYNITNINNNIKNNKNNISINNSINDINVDNNIINNGDQFNNNCQDFYKNLNNTNNLNQENNQQPPTNNNNNQSLNFDNFINNNFNNINVFNLDNTNNNISNNNNNNIDKNKIDNNNIDNINISNNNISKNINLFNGINDKNNNENNDYSNDNNLEHMDISEWLKEQNDKKLNDCLQHHKNNNTMVGGRDAFKQHNKTHNYKHDQSNFNFLSPSACSPTSSRFYNSPLTHVLLSPPFYTNSLTHQADSRPFNTSSVSERSLVEREQAGFLKQVKPGIPLVSVVGEISFDPSKRTFTADELKVSQIVPKSEKKFVPNERKDNNYWSRRTKNNKAAKRSREAKRMKENQINLRTAFLEDENAHLRNDIGKLLAENKDLRIRLAKYEI